MGSKVDSWGLELDNRSLQWCIERWIAHGQWIDGNPRSRTDPLRLMPHTIAATWRYWQSPEQLWASMNYLRSGQWTAG